MFQIHTMPVGGFQCNCSIIGCPETKEAVIVDPGGDAQRITAHVTEQGYKVRYLVHTHAHFDHFGATDAVQQCCGGQVALHKADMFLYDQAAIQAMMMGLPPAEAPPIDIYPEDEQTFEFGKYQIQTLHTPGHTPGSISFLLTSGDRQLLFAGDTLFQRSIGRTDMPGGDSRQIAVSIVNRLFTLDDDTLVIPGHGPNTTIGEEIHENPFVGQRR